MQSPRLLSAVVSLMLLAAVSIAHGKDVVVAVFDRGIDPSDARLQKKIWLNTGESPTALDVDGDGNGFKGDYYGWSVINQTGQIFTPHLESADKISRFLRLNELEQISYYRNLTASEVDEQEHVKENVLQKKYAEFMGHAHGQHVAGLVLQGTQNTKIVPVTVVRSETEKPESIEKLPKTKAPPFFLFEMPARYFGLAEVREPLYPLVQSYLQELEPALQFIKTRPVQLVNMSISTDVRGILTQHVVNLWFQNFMSNAPDRETLMYVHAAQKYMSTYLYSWLIENRDKLFVMAAGNWVDDTGAANNNDTDPMFPSSVTRWFQPPNVLVVAATRGRESLATFSAYGEETVDVAAPGVNISSFLLNGDKIAMSGTSQAAPYVTNTAAKMLEVNPHLNVEEIRRILLETVDKKDFLKGKVKSEGIVNPSRAIWAAEWNHKLGTAKAIEQARLAVADL